MNPVDQDSISRRVWLQRMSGPALLATVGAGISASALGQSPAASQAPTRGAESSLLGARIYNVRDFGAKGDGTTPDTVAVQAAIEACHADQGGTVLVPAG